MKKNELTNPAGVGLIGAMAVITNADRRPDPVQQAWCLHNPWIVVRTCDHIDQYRVEMDIADQIENGACVIRGVRMGTIQKDLKSLVAPFLRYQRVKRSGQGLS